MESELMPQCGACGSRGTHKVGAETAAPAVGCHCGVIVTGFTEAEATERWERLARRAEIGALVERMMSDPRSVALRFGSAVDLTDGSEYVDAILWYRAAEESGRTQSYGQGGTLLDALRALAAEIGGKNA